MILRRLNNITSTYENSVNVVDNSNIRTGEFIFIIIIIVMCSCILPSQYKKAQQILEEDRLENRRCIEHHRKEMYNS